RPGRGRLLHRRRRLRRRLHPDVGLPPGVLRGGDRVRAGGQRAAGADREDREAAAEGRRPLAAGMTTPYDVFLSYHEEDAAWARGLAEDLWREGLRVFFAPWDIIPGDVIARRLEEGIAAPGAVVVCSAATASRWLTEEQAALWTRAERGFQRVVP